ncbi:hypothetical protein BHE74_00039101 [Ensete ventricosum]|uniref:HIG1 domain-containing protein n=1 Tax=Ensete ventricosum TaxID=4639 RepID=A0A445ME97_ENSVE|nr:hypothetical protein BHE74_00039101 [Ensete ventricosum]RZR72577.1 hypothetical protein BHM03_00014744 [Ensete ventricosum]
MSSLQSWVAEHKLTSIGKISSSPNSTSFSGILLLSRVSSVFLRRCCVGFSLGTSLAVAHKRSPTVKTSLRLIHAIWGRINVRSCHRMHAQAITLAVLSGAALLHYFDGKDKSATDDVESATPPPWLN